MYDIKVALREIGRGNVNWIYLAQDRDKLRDLVHMVTKLLVP